MFSFFGLFASDEPEPAVVETFALPDNEQLVFKKADLESWRLLFNSFDGNGNGTIDRVEFDLINEETARRSGKPPRDAKWIARAFAEADKDKSGAIDFKEYVLVCHRQKAIVDAAHGASALVSKEDRASAAKAVAHVTSLAVLRETLEQATRSSADPDLKRESERLLRALGDVGRPMLAAAVFEDGEKHLSPRSKLAARNDGLTVLGELGVNAASNMVDAAAVRDQLELQQPPRGAAAEPPSGLSSLSFGLVTSWDELLLLLPQPHEVEVLFSYFQFQGLTNMLAISFLKDFPTLGYAFELPPIFRTWQAYIGWMSFFNIDLQALTAWVANQELPDAFRVFGELPYASTYLIVTAVLPLGISFVNLLLFRPLHEVVWLWTSVISFTVTFATVVAKATLDEERLAVVGGGSLSPELLTTLLYAGIAVFVAMQLALAAFQWHKTYAKLQAAEEEVEGMKGLARENTMLLRNFVDEKRQEERLPPALPPWLYARNVGFTLFCAFYATFDLWSDVLNVGPELSVVFFFGALVSLVYNALTFTQGGRVLLREMSILINQAAVFLFLLILSLLYMPVTRMLFAVWLWEERVCPPGTRFPKFASEISLSSAEWLSSGLVRCEPCAFADFGDAGLTYAVQFETAGECVASFCPGETTFRSYNDPRLAYFDMILPFFGPASLLMLFGFTVGVPYLYYSIISEHTKMFTQIAVKADKVVEQTGRKKGDVEWGYRVSGSNNRARSLYAIFQYQFRYTKLVIVLQKLLVIAVVIFLYQYVIAASITISVVHFAYLCYQLAFRPFFDPKSDWLSITVTFASAFNPLVIVLTHYGVMQRWDFSTVQAFILLINFALPGLVLAVGWVFSLRKKRRRAAKEDKIEEEYTESEVHQIEKARRVLDIQLDAATLKYVLRVFVVMAATGFVSVALLMLGQSWQAATTVVVASTSPELGGQLSLLYAECEIEELLVNNEFASYGSWTEFTQYCCCADRQSEYSFGEAFVANATELWTCASGYMKERLRGDTLDVRGFCSPAFSEGYSLPAYDEAARQLVVRGALGVTVATGW